MARSATTRPALVSVPEKLRGEPGASVGPSIATGSIDLPESGSSVK